MNSKIHFAIWIGLALLCLTTWVSSPLALFGGAAMGLLFGNPDPDLSKKISQKLLMFCVMGLGAGMDLKVVGRVGAHGVLYTVAGIGCTLILGYMLGKLFKCAPAVATLVSVGTAICGGSAIAAVAPVIKAKQHDMTVALAVVFLLNASALLLFPWVGHRLGLSERAFGLWSALAIHDTSSVVGATMQYGKEALAVGTTVKLARALWIVPLTVLFAWRTARSDKDSVGSSSKVKFPWFIAGFILVAALVTFVPVLQSPGVTVSLVAKKGLVLTLYFIGSNLTRQSLKSVGFLPFLLGALLWFCVATGSLCAIVFGWIGV